MFFLGFLDLVYNKTGHKIPTQEEHPGHPNTPFSLSRRFPQKSETKYDLYKILPIIKKPKFWTFEVFFKNLGFPKPFFQPCN